MPNYLWLILGAVLVVFAMASFPKIGGLLLIVLVLGAFITAAKTGVLKGAGA